MRTRLGRLAAWLCSPRTQTKIWGAVLVALTVAWFTHWFGPSKRSDLASLTLPVKSAELPDRKPEVPPSASSRIQFSDWQQLVKATRDAESRRLLAENYRGETVVWEGVLDAVNTVPSSAGASANQKFLLVMYESESVRASDALGRAPALCLLPETAASDLENLHPGQRITVRGTLAAPETLHGTLLGTRLYNCEILRR